MKKLIIFGIIVIAFVMFMIFLRFSSESNVLKNFNEEAKLYKSMSCGCCGIHFDYLKNKGLDVKKIEMQDISEIKQNFGIPPQLESCHTTLIGKYFVEGHVPAEAIEKLIKERPDIAGISLPGMPSGSPGMPGTKNAEWIIYSINKDGSYGEFIRI